jgi:hypothetical protein
MKHVAIVSAFCLAVIAAPGCSGDSGGSGGSDGSLAGSGQTAETPDAGSVPDEPATAPQLPDISGEVIGMPGRRVPGLAASYVGTGRGWLGPDDDVVFDAVVLWDSTKRIGCGILRSDSNGVVNKIMMQGQRLAGTDGGQVKHPGLPIAGDSRSVVMSVGIDGGSFERGLFRVDLDGLNPVLLAVEDSGSFHNAVIADDDTVLVAHTDSSGSSLLAITDDETTTLLDDIRPDFATDGSTVVAHDGLTAWHLELDGTRERLLGTGDPVPGMAAAMVESIASAWITADGVPVVHARTNDPDRPDAIVRFDAAPELVAACGDPAPGSDKTYLELHPAAGSTEDIVFGALLAGDGERTSAIFCARPGEAVGVLAASGDPAGDLGVPMLVSMSDVVATGGGGAIFVSLILDPSQTGDIGVFTVTSSGGVERRVTTNARVSDVDGGTVTKFLLAFRESMDLAEDGTSLVHVGIELDRQPGATYGALIRTR